VPSAGRRRSSARSRTRRRERLNGSMFAAQIVNPLARIHDRAKTPNGGRFAAAGVAASHDRLLSVYTGGTKG
jgi:hypothetical protein